MIDELIKAKEKQAHDGQITKHIENVQLLCDLLLTSDRQVNGTNISNTQRENITEQEMKAMIIGKQTKNKQMKTQQLDQLRKQSEPEDEGNGDSLFDF